jgi:hypothetical protein
MTTGPSRSRVKRLVASIVIASGLFHGASPAMAQDPSARHTPPMQYKLSDVTLEIIQSSPIRTRGTRQILLSSREASWLDVKGQPRRTFEFSRASLFESIRRLYALRFFDLPTQPTPEFVPHLMPDDLVRTSTTELSDTGSTRVCFRTKDFEKCVTYALDGPEALRKWVQSIEAEAVRLAESK